MGEQDPKKKNNHNGNEGGKGENEIHPRTLLAQKLEVEGIGRKLLIDPHLLKMIEENDR